jgi:hypothetical protein
MPKIKVDGAEIEVHQRPTMLHAWRVAGKESSCQTCWLVEAEG